MRKIFLVLVMIVAYTAAFSQLAQQPVRYAIQATLNNARHTLDGSVQIYYRNLSRDTLHYFWIQLWPNAFKNDRTAYSEKMLDEGSNEFYFSTKEQKGYINRLAFQSGNVSLLQENDPQHIDLIKVILPGPLLPNDSILIGTPFHLQLPNEFSGFGWSGQEVHLRNWYPAVAPFDGSWRPEPFTGQRQRVIADYDISLTVPEKYIVRADARPLDSLVADTLKTLRYHAENVTDFAWSAEKQGAKHPEKKIDLGRRADTLVSKILSRPFLPALGYNVYDGLQLGILYHLKNDTGETPLFLAPMFGTASRTLTGYGGFRINVAPGKRFKKITLGMNAARFSDLKGTDSAGKRVDGYFTRLAPFVRVEFPKHHPHTKEWLEFKTFVIAEKDLDYAMDSVDSFYYPVNGKTKTRYLNQLTFAHASNRSLYPYDAQLQVQQAKDFYRINAELHYFFNYPGGGGLQARLFAAKFGYIGSATSSDTYRYQPKLTAVRGSEDYTYGDPFIGRNEFSGFSSRQIMLRDGGLKLRTDMFQDLQGRSDNWVASMNLNTTLPTSIVPQGFPLKLFLDAGTYADPWQKNSSLPKLLYVAGLQLSLLHNSVNIYAPVLYSGRFRDNLKTVPGENGFLKQISFSLDFTHFVAIFLHGS